jgi:hypothetical protein
MKYPGYNSGNVILSEGEWFPFKIHNLVQLQDGAWYYILQDINGLKHFMTAANYEKYGLETGNELTCKIERINCTGRIFLEPRHPIYKEGEIYSFDVINFLNTGNENLLIVKDILGNIIEVPVNGTKIVDIIDAKSVRCKVQSIKKGSLIIEFLPDRI